MASIPIGELLVDNGQITPEELEQAEAENKKTGEPIASVLAKLGFITENSLKNALELQYGVMYMNLSKREPDHELISMLPEATIRAKQTVPVAQQGDRLTVAMVDPNDEAALGEIQKTLDGKNVKPVVCLEEQFVQFVDRAFGVETKTTNGNGNSSIIGTVVKPAEAKSESGPESESTTDAKSESEAEAKAEPSAEAKSEPAPEAKSESAPEAKSEPAPEAKSESAPATKSGPEPEAKSEPEPEAKSEPAPEAKSEPAPEVKSEPAAEPASESGAEAALALSRAETAIAKAEAGLAKAETALARAQAGDAESKSEPAAAIGSQPTDSTAPADNAPVESKAQDVSPVPGESKTTESSAPAESKAAESSAPAESKAAESTAPTESKTAESPQAEAKSAEDEPAPKSEADQLTETDLAKRAQEEAIVLLANQILGSAIKRHCSNIHITMGPRESTVKYRLNGRLMVDRKLPNTIVVALVARYKMMARLNLAERKEPQDGHIKVKSAAKEIVCLITVVPQDHGENVVIWIV